jgi:two-component system, OmpR family, phosphate regulon sensor histidine kinase PhoR
MNPVMEKTKSYEQLLAENEELAWQLSEANDTIEAIRTGQVDALVVNNGGNHQLYTLKTADQTYRVFIEKMSQGAVTIGENGLILYSNSRFAEMVKYPLDKVIGQVFEKFVTDGSKKKYRQLVSSGWKEDIKEEIDIVDIFSNKTCCLCSCASLDMDGGVALSLILTDLTAQKANQLQLQLQNEQLEVTQNMVVQQNDELEATVKERTKDLSISREHFKILSDHITQMTWTNLPNGEVSYYNQRWYQYTGLTFAETKKHGWQAVMHPDDIEETLEKFTNALQTGQIFEVENRYRRGADGVYRWHLNRAMPLKTENGDILFWVGTATDIDDQKRELERKDEFIGVASHELKTPLTSLKGYLQLITVQSKDSLSPAMKNYLDRANLSICKLQHLIDDLLDVSKINAGRLNYTLETVDLGTIVASCIENAVHMYPHFEFEFHNGIEPIVKGNAERLEQVIMNLVSNAVKYSKDDKRVMVKMTLHENWVRVSITDFGIGLQKEQQKRIFDRFYRVEEDKKYLISGLGMGLYISAQIINTHGGTIGVESELRKGSTFYFELSLADS